MSLNLIPVLYRELENLDKHPDSRRDAMKTLKSYVKDLDSKSVPMFLVRISEVNDLGSSSSECTISLLEILARSQGCNIVPHIDNIMDIVLNTLSSSAAFFALHQACSRVVNTIARFGIDPLKPESEKKRIICSLSKPLYDDIQHPQENTASGAALCLTALVESDNWRFASDDAVNEICLRVAGAFDDTRTQTQYHMGLVMSLLKHNSLIVDPYARSLLRSGSQILTSCSEEGNSQKKLLAIQMINFLMKCVDSRSISTELASIINVMESCQNDRLPFVRGAAFEALQTAKLMARQKGSRQEVSPILDFERRVDSKNTQTVRHGFSEPGDTTSVDYDVFADSPQSPGQFSCHSDYGMQASRRLWNSDVGNVDVSPEDCLYDHAGSEYDGSLVHVERFRDDELLETQDKCAVTNGSLLIAARNGIMNSPNPTLQRSRQEHGSNNINKYSTPRNLIQSRRNSVASDSRDHDRRHWTLIDPTSAEVEWKGENDSHNTNHDVEVKCNECTQLVCCNVEPTNNVLKTRRCRFGKAVVSIICVIVIVLAIFMSYDANEMETSYVVPT